MSVLLYSGTAFSFLFWCSFGLFAVVLYLSSALRLLLPNLQSSVIASSHVRFPPATLSSLVCVPSFLRDLVQLWSFLCLFQLILFSPPLRSSLLVMHSLNLLSLHFPSFAVLWHGLLFHCLWSGSRETKPRRTVTINIFFILFIPCLYLHFLCFFYPSPSPVLLSTGIAFFSTGSGSAKVLSMPLPADTVPLFLIFYTSCLCILFFLITILTVLLSSGSLIYWLWFSYGLVCAFSR